jgi:hypothetical protein
MKFFINSAYPYHPQKNFAAMWLRESAASDPFKVHQICSDPNSADIILFAEHHPPQDPYFFQVLQSDIYKKFKHKCYIYHDNPNVLPLLPGVFPSIEKKYYNPCIMQPGPYIARLCTNDEVTYYEKKPLYMYLFSFVGAVRTHPVRENILRLKHDSCFLKDTSDKNSWELDPSQKKLFEEEYAKISLQSQFVLCPRGVGPNSYRLYEIMEMGIAPVIISDDWVPLPGPDWESFSIQVPESSINIIPSLLEERKEEAELMGLRARKAWEEWFSKEVSFHHIAEACVRLHNNRNKFNSLLWIRIYSQFLRPFHLRNLLRFIKKRIKT